MEIAKIDAFIQAIKSTQHGSEHVEAFSRIKNNDIHGASEIWEQFNGKHPDDYISAHHLAIIQHSSAWELEQKGKCVEALEHWKKSLFYWARLLKADNFWDDLTRKMIKFATDNTGFDFYLKRFNTMRDHLPEELRDEYIARDTWRKALEYWFQYREIPEWWKPFEIRDILLGGVDLRKFNAARQELTDDLLRIHYSLIEHYVSASQISNARSHMELIMKSEFPDENKLEIRRDLANKLLPDRDSVEKGHKFEEGIRGAKILLDVDTENHWGLEFLIFSYNEWNFYLAQQKNLDGIERNMRVIKREGYRNRLWRAKDYPHCAPMVRISIEKEIKRINEPIIIVCFPAAGEYLERIQRSGPLSSVERRELMRFIDNIVEYGNDIIGNDEMNAVRSLRDMLESVD